MAYQYDVTVIGGGAAGLTSAGLAAGFGARTMLVESNKLGGDCTWYGCVPSKTLVTSAKAARFIHTGKNYGLDSQELPPDTSGVFDRIRMIRRDIYAEADDPTIYEKMGIEVKIGRARFKDSHTLEINEGDGFSPVTSRYFVIATGSRPVIPPIAGIENSDYLTNETVFDLKDKPESLIIIGAGPVGLETAQSFCRLGCQVTVVDRMDRILIRDDERYAAILQKSLEEEGVRFVLNTDIRNVRHEGKTVRVDTGNEVIEAERLMLAAGRRPDVDSLNPGAAGVEYTKAGITVNRHCRTSRKHIFSCGDVTGRYQLTHMADHMAKVAISNMLLKYPMKIDDKHVTWCTYTDPEVAHAGLQQRQLDEKGRNYKVYRFPFAKLDRAMVEGETTGWIKVFARPLTGKILGATIIGAHAGEMISELALAMKNGVTLRNIADTIHPYPTYGLGVRRVADQWYVQRQSRGLVKLLQMLFRYRGNLPDVSDKDRIV